MKNNSELGVFMLPSVTAHRGTLWSGLCRTGIDTGKRVENRIENMEMDLHLNKQLIFIQGTKATQTESSR